MFKLFVYRNLCHVEYVSTSSENRVFCVNFSFFFCCPVSHLHLNGKTIVYISVLYSKGDMVIYVRFDDNIIITVINK